MSPQAAAPTDVSQRRSGWQHPNRQLLESQRVKTHTPAEHAWSVRQALHSPASLPQAVAVVPGRQTPSPSKQPPHELPTQTPNSQRRPALHVPQKARGGPQAAGSLFGAQLPSGRQQEVAQLQVSGPASTTPASTTGFASHRAATHRSCELQRTHATPPTPHSKRVVPSTHSPVSAQHPSQFDALQGFWHPATTSVVTSTSHLMWVAL